MHVRLLWHKHEAVAALITRGAKRMAQKRSKFWRGPACDMAMLTLYFLLFPVIHALYPHVSETLYQLLAGLLLGGISAMSLALLKDGVLRWRHAGFAGIESARSLGIMAIVLVYPTLGIVSGLIWLVGTGSNGGRYYAIGFTVSALLMGRRAKAALARKR